MDLFSLYATIGIKMDEFERGLDSASQKFESFSSGIKNVGEKISDAGGTLTKGVTLPLAGLGTAVLKTGMDYEAGMSKVQAISGATGDEITLLGQKAMEMAAKTKFSTADSTEAYQYMAMAGWKAGDMVDGLAGIMNLAAASGENLGTTSDIVTDALTAFGLKASDSGRFADVLAAASNNANTNVSMLGESFKYVAPVAGALGYSVEDTSVALGLMANSGIKASQAGTSLRTAMTNMASPTSNMAAVMKEYGLSLTDADGNMLSLAEVMAQLREKMGGLDEATQSSAASLLFGKEAMSGMLAIINAAPADFDKLTEAINNSKGTTEKMASIMQDNAAGAFERLKSAVNVLFTQLSEQLIPIFTSVVEKATEIVNWFGSLDSETQKLILTIAGIAAAVGPVLIIVGKIVTAIGQIASGIGGLIGIVGKAGSAFSGLFSILAANPIVAVIAAVTALAAGIIFLWNTNEDFRNAVGAIWEAIKGFFVGAWEAIQAAWGAAGEFFGGIVDGIMSAFEGIGEFLGGLFESAWEMVQGAWDAAVEFFTGIGDGIHEAFEIVTSFLGEAFSAAWDVVAGAWEAATGFFGDIWDNIKGAAEKAADKIGGALSDAWDAVTTAWGGAMDFFGGIWEDIKGVFGNACDAFKTIGGDMLEGLWNGIGDKVEWLKSKVFGVVNTIKSWFTGKDGFDEHSPSKWSETVFYRVMQGGINGLNDGESILMREVNSISDRVKSGLNFGSATVGVNASYSGSSRYGAQGAAGWPGGGAGDTYVTINSPLAVDAVQAAREWSKTAQRMAIGYV